MTTTATGFSGRMWPRRVASTVLVCACALGAVACTPTIKVQAPDKPIEINLNVKIEQEIRIKVDRELDDLFANNPDLF
ncbi:YnbE family lipoprotein [Pyruvatibacter sp.]|uniref:YnbE family lipoprotein n=1 Tax=Pyruvatibacter sp. TaxID=1981328 RepID=UPI0032EFA941